MTNNHRYKNLFAWIIMSLMMVLMIALFVFKDSLINYASKGMQHQITPISKGIFADSVAQLYNYTNTDKNYQYTLLEFNGAGCNVCRKMEKELDELNKTHGRRINIVIYQMTRPNGLQWGKYYGVVMIPTQIILDHTGKEIFRDTGFMSKEDLLKQME